MHGYHLSSFHYRHRNTGSRNDCEYLWNMNYHLLSTYIAYTVAKNSRPRKSVWY